MPRSSRIVRGLAVFVVGLATTMLAACSPAAPQESPSKARELVIGATASPDALDPSTNTAAAIPQVLLYNVYETLIKIDNQGQMRPLLATEWSVSTDRLIYTFTLQPKARFASGAPVNAQAVVSSIQRIQNDPSVLPVLKNQMSVVASSTAINDTTVQVVLTRPSNNWLYSMTQTAGIIYDPTAMGNLASQPAGSGPFKVKQWRKGESLTLIRNDNYWGTPTKFDSATFRYFSDPNAENAALLSGDLDLITNLESPQSLPQFSDTSRFQVLQGTTNGEVVLGFNDAREPFTDVRVRQAINYAIDRAALLQTVWGGKGLLIGSMVPPTDPWYEDLSNTYPYDPAKARDLLAQAGHPSGLKLTLRVPTRSYATAAAQFVASQLKDVGIDVTVEQLEFPARWVDEVMNKGNYDMTIIEHVEPRDIANWADPKYYWHYNNPEFSQLVAQADAAPADQQVALMKQAAKILATDAAGDFLWLMPNLVVARTDLAGIGPNQTSLSFDLTTISSRDI